MFKMLWILFCMLAGAAIGAGFLGGLFNSWTLAAVGVVIGVVPGYFFGKFVPMSEAIVDLLG